MARDRYTKELQKIMTATGPARPCSMTQGEIETAIANISEQLKGPLSNMERLCLIEDRIGLRKVFASRIGKAAS